MIARFTFLVPPTIRAGILLRGARNVRHIVFLSWRGRDRLLFDITPSAFLT